MTVRSRSWYDELRSAYRPEHLRVLLIGESPPDPGIGARRFFYAPKLSIDNLYRGVAQAVYGREPGFDVRAKPEILRRLQQDGFWLIDAVEQPVNKVSAPLRRESIAQAVPGLVDRCLELAPERGVVICHGLVYRLAAPELRARGVTILHREALPFPLGNWRSEFVTGMRQALAGE